MMNVSEEVGGRRSAFGVDGKRGPMGTRLNERTGSPPVVAGSLGIADSLAGASSLYCGWPRDGIFVAGIRSFNRVGNAPPLVWVRARPDGHAVKRENWFLTIS